MLRQRSAPVEPLPEELELSIKGSAIVRKGRKVGYITMVPPSASSGRKNRQWYATDDKGNRTENCNTKEAALINLWYHNYMPALF